MILDPEDRRIFGNLMKLFGSKLRAGMDLPELVLAAGRYFLGAPYVVHSLEHRPETLVINLQGFDCFTFVENAVALAGFSWKGETGFSAYAAFLQSLRYRKGLIDGYPSRLHYFTDWVYENSRQRIVKDVTRELGGRSFRKQIYHMTSHRKQYPALQTEEYFQRMRETEKRISRRIRYEIPREAVRAIENEIADGDLIAILTDQAGIDCLHVGLAIHLRDRLHLLHASRKDGGVVISQETLSSYLSARAERSGILVARVASSVV